MVSNGPVRRVARAEWKGRLDNARAFLTAAEDLMELVESGRSCNPIITQCVDAAIGYGDAVTIRFGGMVNTVDHHALGITLGRAIGARFSARPAQQLSQILAEKDEAAFGARLATEAEARAVLTLAKRFAEWAIRAGSPIFFLRIQFYGRIS